MTDDRLRALVVEDDCAWQEILGEILRDMGLGVDQADSYEAGLAWLRAAPYRLAVVDLSLSDHHQDHEGLRVLEAVRTYAPGCAAILLTGFATVELAVSAMTEYGAHTCLRKETFRRASFRELLQRILASPPPTLSVSSAPRPKASPMAVARTDLPPPTQPAQQGQALVVENDAGWRTILAELLSEAGYQVQACLSYGEALGFLLRERFALAVVDLSLVNPASSDGNHDGYQVLESTRTAGIPALVVSGLANPDDIKHAYAEYGIFAYLEKQAFDRQAFLAMVASARETSIASGTSPALQGVDPAILEQLGRLTPRERAVLELLVQGLTNKGIAKALVISTNTVKSYLKTIFEKLEVTSRAAAVAKAVSAGIK